MSFHHDSRAHPRAADGSTRPFDVAAAGPQRSQRPAAPLEVTRLRKKGGVLTKQISRAPDGSLDIDGSGCAMSEGWAFRERLVGIRDFGALVAGLGHDEALALGALRDGLPDEVRVVPGARLREANGAADAVARTGDFLRHRPGAGGFVLIDHDRKGMPPEVAARLQETRGLRRALDHVMPDFANCSFLMRRSTSSGIRDTATGEEIPGSGGFHVYIEVVDASDNERFLRDLHRRCWLAGLGWLLLGAGGQFLERSIVDRMVGGPERLVFEAPPVLGEGLSQDSAARAPRVRVGAPLDTRAACPPLNAAETAKHKDLVGRARHGLAERAVELRRSFVSTRAIEMAKRLDISEGEARKAVARQCEGVLRPRVALEFDDPGLAGKTVGDVLAEPERFVGETLADPVEGVAYGRCKAKVMRRRDGAVWIHSFAHGRTDYRLCHDLRAVDERVNAAPPGEVGDALEAAALASDLTEDELDAAVAVAAKAAEPLGIGKAALKKRVRAARERRDEERRREERDRRAAERAGGRVELRAPGDRDERTPVVEALDHVLRNVGGDEPPMRDLEGWPVEVRLRPQDGVHLLTAAAANGDGADGKGELPAPDVPLLTRLDEVTMGLLVERHVCHFVDTRDEDGRKPVALAQPFVKAYMGWPGSDLPRVSGVVTLPLVLPNGAFLAENGVRHGHLFRVDRHILGLLPSPSDSDDEAVREAMGFLLDDWLVDVAATAQGKCVVLAMALTIIERALLRERPAFFVSAPQRGGGKTTLISMTIAGVTGHDPGAARWSSDPEERRKALYAYFRDGPSHLVFDNMPRGARVSCPTLESALTGSRLSDRVLGTSENQTVPSTTVVCFTGNNIGPHGDMCSRSLTVGLRVDRPDPENRGFAHADPIGWTRANRARVLRALYTILLANPAENRQGDGQTRFKTWWRLVGSAVEHAAGLYGAEARLSFRDILKEAEATSGEALTLLELLKALQVLFRGNKVKGSRHLLRDGEVEFRPGDASRMRNTPVNLDKGTIEPGDADIGFPGDREPDGDAITLREAINGATSAELRTGGAREITARLSDVVGVPVEVDGVVYVLEYEPDKKHGGIYRVKRGKPSEGSRGKVF